MDKRIEANALVKRKIIDAFFLLLEKKDISRISVSELTTVAGVARSSFYRNFTSIISVLEEYVDQLTQEFNEGNPISGVNLTSYEYMYYVFQFYYDHRERILFLYNRGFSQCMLKHMTDYFTEAFGDMTMHSLQRYSINYFSGALFAIIVEWLSSGAKESIDIMAKSFRSMVLNDMKYSLN